MKNNRVFRLALAGIFAAAIFLATYFLQIPAPTGNINLGDGVILLAAVWLGYDAILPAALASALSDLLGYPLYAPATLVIKAAMALVAVLLMHIAPKRRAGRLAAFAAAEMVMIVGYFCYDTILYSVGGAFVNIAGNAVQAAAGVVLGLALSMLHNPVDKMNKV